MPDMSLCYIATVIASVVLLVWGIMDILKKRRPEEDSHMAVISRQIRGFGLLLLSQIVLILGSSVCFGVSGGVEKVLKKVGDLF